MTCHLFCRSFIFDPLLPNVAFRMLLNSSRYEHGPALLYSHVSAPKTLTWFKPSRHQRDSKGKASERPLKPLIHLIGI